MMHTLSGEYDFSLILFHDENADKKISKSAQESPQIEIIEKAEKDLNVFIKFLLLIQNEIGFIIFVLQIERNEVLNTY